MSIENPTNWSADKPIWSDTAPIKIGNLKMINAYIGRLWENFYPVGSIYMSMNSTYPGVLFGVGVWEKINGRFLYATEEGQESGDTGGDKNAVVVYHTHTGSSDVYNGSYFEDFIRGNGFDNKKYGPDMIKGDGDSIDSNDIFNWKAHNHKINIAHAGVENNGANANMPPYLTVHMWQRTA